MNKPFCTTMLLLPLLSVLAQAHCGDYAAEVVTVLSRNIVARAGCQIDLPKLVRVPWNDQTVDAWDAGYDLQVTMAVRSRIDHYDQCRGNYLWSETQDGSRDENLHFNVANPNLGADLPSYVANAPLTDTEVRAALAVPLAQCEAVHLGPWPR